MPSATDGESLLACICTAHDALEARVTRAMDAQSQFLLKEMALLIDGKLQAALSDPCACVPPRSPCIDKGLAPQTPRIRFSLRTSSDPEASLVPPQGVLHSPASVLDVRAARQELKKTKRAVFASTGSRASSSGEVERSPTAPLQQVRNMTTSRFFEVFIAVAILANAICIGVGANWKLGHPGAETPEHFKILDIVFLSIFALELMIRVVAEGREFLSPRSRMFSWNAFDASLVGLCVFNEVNPFSFNLSVVRMFRTLRLVNVLRIIRLNKRFRELRMMVDGIMNCGKTLCWSFCILMIVTYIYAVFIIEIANAWLTNHGSPLRPLSEQDEATKEFLDTNFPSVLWSVYTLGKTVSGGVSWGEISDYMWHVSPALLVSFPFYIMVTVFCVLNIITAAFCEAAARTALEDDSNALEHIEVKREQLSKIVELFQRHDLDQGGTLDWEEFQAIACDWRTQAYFSEIGVDFSFTRIKTLFDLFDFDGDGNININEFAQGMHHLRGGARSVDMFREFSVLKKKTHKMQRSLDMLAEGEFEMDLNSKSLCELGRASVCSGSADPDEDENAMSTDIPDGPRGGGLRVRPPPLCGAVESQ